MASARAGNLDTRARAQTAYRLFLSMRWRIGPDGARRVTPMIAAASELNLVDQLEMSIDEEAGSILEAEMAHDLSLLRRYYENVHKE